MFPLSSQNTYWHERALTLYTPAPTLDGKRGKTSCFQNNCNTELVEPAFLYLPPPCIIHKVRETKAQKN